VSVRLDLSLPGDLLTAALVDVPSVSGAEGPLADAVEVALRALPHLTVRRDGDAVVARTHLGRPARVVLAGHLDTVPIADNLPSRRAGQRLYGCGACDMKSGVAVLLRLAASVHDPRHDYTVICYDNEEVEAARNGLGRLARHDPDALRGDLAILLEPTDARIEAGCQGTLRVDVTVRGRRAHSARAWLGDNAVHRAGDVLSTLASYVPRRVPLDGVEYREGLNAVRISGGVAGNVVPDECTLSVNYRFAPDRSEGEALAHVRAVVGPHEVVLTDTAPGARPGLTAPAVAEFAALAAAMTGQQPVAKLGWTDVARFAALGIPAVNFGPGDPNLAHVREEYVDVPGIMRCEQVMLAYLTGADPTR
jgi:succinyl-diaminopimelate desuccinylase